MARQLTKKQELFILAYREHGNQIEAYRSAYDVEKMTNEAVRVEAWRLLKNPIVSQRLKELSDRAATNVVLTRAWVLEKLMLNVQQAQAAADYAAANKGLELLGKTEELGGMFMDRAHVTSDNRHTIESQPLSAFIQHLEDVGGFRDPGEPQKLISQ